MFDVSLLRLTSNIAPRRDCSWAGAALDCMAACVANTTMLYPDHSNPGVKQPAGKPAHQCKLYLAG